ncbi:MAG: nuclear transport factor 2 family protein [Calditrichaeota bacterium]|nr:nuclear transport factor 2 family protein [Calditrichota bacterium]
MKLLICYCLIIITANAQEDRQGALAAVMDYIEGTANGEISRIRNAFETNASLYTINSENDLVQRPSQKYIAGFTEGKKNNRIGQVVYLDVVHNAATAIVEIISGKRKYTDYILLLKIKDQWKIIQKSYTYVPIDYKGKILFVVSNFSSYGNVEKRTGTHFSELVQVYDGLLKAGYEVDFVSPQGGEIPVAYIDLSDDLQKTYFYDRKLQYKLKYSYRPSDIDSKNYKGIFYVGGSATMFDIPENADIMSLAKQIYEDQNGVIGAVCHGVGGLVNLKLKSGDYLVAGKRINSFTNKEEESGSNWKYLPFLIETKLKERGALYFSSDNWQEHVETSERLVTGQNPASCRKLVSELIKQLEMN